MPCVGMASHASTSCRAVATPSGVPHCMGPRRSVMCSGRAMHAPIGGASPRGVTIGGSSRRVEAASAGGGASSTPAAAAGTLDEALGRLGDEQRAALAAEWGYEQLGAKLPAGLGLGVVGQAVPEEVTLLDWKALALGIALPLSLMVAGYAWMWYMHGIIPGWQQAICWVLVGTGYFGLFTVAHDASRMALLTDNPELQTTLGSLLMAPSLYSLEAWRVQLLIHYAQPNMLGEDDSGWQPLTKARLVAMGDLERRWARLAATTPLKLLGSLAHWARSFGGFDLKKYYPPMRLTMIGSWSVPFVFMAVAWPALIAGGGLAAWFDCWLMPWLIFHLWLSTLTLLQHTAPHVPFEPPGGSYDAAQAAVNGTVTVSLPAPLELVLNYANYHLPQHLSGSVPFYHAKAATQAIDARLGPFLTKANLNGRLLRNLVERWQVYDEETRQYITFDAAVADISPASVRAQAA
ncbi:hypothetical protein FOA52_008600 [Chlamydomonas sp. UWO 241]|nr:hypothetical protein FOA52_008600 [Chlamydomonas sp. UWO 241]